MLKQAAKKLIDKPCTDGLKSRFCVVLGLQWGSEGKHKLLDKLCPDYDYSCRYNGGVLTEPTYLDNGDKLHMLPTGAKVDTPVKSLLGNGVSIDP